jgi:hypothetical protein
MTDDRDPCHDNSRASPQQKAAREARLAAQLRENLHRRKAQARAMARPEPDAPPHR